MLALFIENSPQKQLFMGLFLMAAGLVIFPAMFSIMMPIAKWMNGFWIETGAGQVAWRSMKVLVALICSYFVILGAGRLAVFSYVKAGFIASPWQ